MKVAGHLSALKYRQGRSMDLEAEIDRLMQAGRYRHRAAARRHLLMDNQSRELKKRYRRAVRRQERFLVQE